MDNQINNRLRMLIKKEGLTQKYFCEIINISWGTLNTTLKRNANPGTEILIKIADKFPKYSINWLLTGNGDMEISNTSNDTNVDYKNKCLELEKENLILKTENDLLREIQGLNKKEKTA